MALTTSMVTKEACVRDRMVSVRRSGTSFACAATELDVRMISSKERSMPSRMTRTGSCSSAWFRFSPAVVDEAAAFRCCWILYSASDIRVTASRISSNSNV